MDKLRLLKVAAITCALALIFILGAPLLRLVGIEQNAEPPFAIIEDTKSGDQNIVEEGKLVFGQMRLIEVLPDQIVLKKDNELYYLYHRGKSRFADTNQLYNKEIKAPQLLNEDLFDLKSSFFPKSENDKIIARTIDRGEKGLAVVVSEGGIENDFGTFKNAIKSAIKDAEFESCEESFFKSSKLCITKLNKSNLLHKIGFRANDTIIAINGGSPFKKLTSLNTDKQKIEILLRRDNKELPIALWRDADS